MTDRNILSAKRVFKIKLITPGKIGAVGIALKQDVFSIISKAGITCSGNDPNNPMQYIIREALEIPFDGRFKVTMS